MRTYLLAGAAAVALNALALTPAMAVPVGNPIVLSGYVDASYQYDQLDGSGGSSNINGNLWNVNGAVVAPIANNWFLQANAAYNGASISHANINQGYGAVTGGWVDGWGRVGATVSYSQLRVDAGGAGLTFDSWTYGGFADIYATPGLTLSLRGGAVSGDLSAGGSSIDYSSAWYIGAQGKAYPTPDVAVHADVDYASVNISNASIHATGIGIGGEWRVSPQWPLTLTADYNYSSAQLSNFITGSVTQNAIGVGVKYYFGGAQTTTLIDHQRAGPEEWSASPVIGNSFIF
jgi:hypothetical protein